MTKVKPECLVVPPSAMASATAWQAQCRATVLGVQIDCLRMEEVIELVGQAIAQSRRLRIGVVNAAKLVNMSHDSALRLDVSSSDLVLADGMSVVWAANLGDVKLPERVAGIDLMHAIMAQAATTPIRVFFLGAKQEVCDAVATLAVRDYPGLTVAGVRNGYFDESDEADIVDQINQSRPDVIFVAMTSPKKERFMARWERQLEVPVIHGVGGSFDVYAGKVSRAPVWMQKAGLEWLHRVLQEPGRMWQRYLTTNTLFVLRVIQEAIIRKVRR